MKLRIVIFLFLISLFPLAAQQRVNLSDEAEISIIICGPSHDDSYTLYGHAAFRIQDQTHNLDAIFNYGLFDFSSPNFLYRFAKGETDYKLGAFGTLDYLIEYQIRGSSVTELKLNLTTDEKNKLWDALLINYLPENRVYRYNFFFDNCATRLVSMVEKYVNGTVAYHSEPSNRTFRDLINHCTREHNWLTFGCDLALGSPTDRIATAHETMFLPLFLEKEFKTATIQSKDGTSRPLVKETIVLANEEPEINNYPPERFTPIYAALLILFITAGITYWDWRRKKQTKFFDITLFFIAGIAGCVLFFISVISVHPSVFPNWSLVWLHPLHLAGAMLIAVKRLSKATYWYHFINFVALTLLLAGWIVIPQHLNVAFVPLILTLLIRSGFTAYSHKTEKKK